MTSPASLDYLFHPRSIAVVGVSDDSSNPNMGRAFMKSLLDFKFKGNVYAVNPNGGIAFGSKMHHSIRDIIGDLDYVISAIPAMYTSKLVEDCAARGVKAIHFFTSGYSEIENVKGKELESEILRMARQSGVRIIGPNCMGLYCPKTRLSFTVDLPNQPGFPKRSGPVGLISQSGGNCNYCVREASTRGVYFSKAVSYGNAVDLNESDFLEHLVSDSDTKIIGAYIEGIKDGKRFAEVLKEATRLKPVIIFKGGTTETGARAAVSHTGVVAGSDRIWNGLVKQSGAIQACSMDEIIDVALLFLHMSPPKGRNIAIIGGGGGTSVQATDECTNTGLAVPTLPIQVRQKLEEIHGSEAGHSFRNPADINRPDVFVDAIEIIAACPDIDLLIIHVQFEYALLSRVKMVQSYLNFLPSWKRGATKPVVVVLHSAASGEAKQLVLQSQLMLSKAGFPVYPSFGRAASAISKFIEYHQWQQYGAK